MSVLQRLEIQDELDSFMEQREPPDDPLEDDDYAESIQGYIGGMHKFIAYGPQPTPDDSRIWKGTVGEFFDNAAGLKACTDGEHCPPAHHPERLTPDQDRLRGEWAQQLASGANIPFSLFL